MDQCRDGVCDVGEKGSLTSPVCPRCGGKGKKVERLTVRYQVLGRCQERIRQDQDYRFCMSPSCPVVYFSEGGGGLFTKKDVSRRVTIKETEDPIPVCYCFNFSRRDIEEELRKTGKTKIPDFISAEVKAGNCICEYTNPQGTCCLGNVSAAVKRLL